MVRPVRGGMVGMEFGGSLGERVVAERLRRHWTQKALAAAAAVSDKTVRRLEAGHPVAKETLLAVCGALQISSSQFADKPADVTGAIVGAGSIPDALDRALSISCPPSETVLTVDVGEYLRDKLGPSYEERLRKGESRARIVLVYGAFVVYMLTWTFGVIALIYYHNWQASLLFLLYNFAGYRSFAAGQGTVVQARIEASAFERGKFSVGRHAVTFARVEEGGSLAVSTLPLASGGHAVDEAGPDHLTFRFGLVSGEVVVPFVRKSEGVTRLARMLAARA